MTAVAIVAGTFDTKGPELEFIADCLRGRGIAVRRVDLSTSGRNASCEVTAAEVAACHGDGAGAVFSTDRGAAVTAMGSAFAAWVKQQDDIGGIIAAGGSGGTSLATAGMRQLAVGVPKVMISTVASGQVAAYVGPSDILMLHSVADIQGVNRITARVLSNGAHALAGMMSGPAPDVAQSKPALGLTMFGVTTPCIQAIQKELDQEYDCLVFHATGTGGRAMEALADSGLFAGMLDMTTTELADMIVGGVLACDEDRFGSVIRSRIPYVGSTGALDMVNFGARSSVPAKFEGRNFVVHNPQVTLMRTTAEECSMIGEWIGARLNLMDGPVRFLLPEGGVSLLDVPGKAFFDPVADAALHDAIERTVRQTATRKLVRVPGAINDAGFVAAAIAALREIMG